MRRSRSRAELRDLVVPGRLHLLLRVDALGNHSFQARLEDNRTFYWPLDPKPAADDRGAMYYVVAVVLLYGLSIIFMIASVIKKSKSDHGLSKYMRDLDKVKRLERRQEKFKARMAMQKKRGRYARTSRPLVQGPLSQQRLKPTSVMPSLLDLCDTPGHRQMPMITVQEAPPGTPAPWATQGHFDLPPYSQLRGSYSRGARHISVRTTGTSPPPPRHTLDTLHEHEWQPAQVETVLSHNSYEEEADDPDLELSLEEEEELLVPGAEEDDGEEQMVEPCYLMEVHDSYALREAEGECALAKSGDQCVVTEAGIGPGSSEEEEKEDLLEATPQCPDTPRRTAKPQPLYLYGRIEYV